jgi:tryptophan synthase alpha subunit|nr:MAG TPA: adenine specific DNA methyltransferase [Caudoviricetes sp.]
MSKEIIYVSANILNVHPRNAEFFDDIQGKEYEQFKQSISQDGILSPILVSPDMTVISGHQRLKACKELGINLVPIMIRDDLSDDEKILNAVIASGFGRNKNYGDTEIDTDQVQEITDTAKRRIVYLLGGYYNPYFNKLLRRLYSEAKGTGLLGHTIARTHKNNYKCVLCFIESWFPSKGVINFKQNIDKRIAIKNI